MKRDLMRDMKVIRSFFLLAPVGASKCADDVETRGSAMEDIWGKQVK